ncbi:MAG: hypothetical protein ABSD92_01650 [Candidatus Bathyarchaeia archaeon]
MNNDHNGGANRYSDLGLTLFLIGLTLAGFLFFLIQIMNSYPFWDYINGYRLNLGFFTGIFGDISYLPAPFQFFKFTQVFDFSLALAFVGLFIWELSSPGKVNKKTVASALGFTLLVTGVICAVIVYLQIDVLTGRNLPWGSYAWGSERVAYNTQFLGSEYNCTFLNYTQLLYISVIIALAGFIIWNLQKKPELKAPRSLLIGTLFIISFALLVSGILLMFPAQKFTSPDPNMSATPYAVQGVMLVWTGAAFLMSSIVGLCLKLKQIIDHGRNSFSMRRKRKVGKMGIELEA